jgi:hypothetical protein
MRLAQVRGYIDVDNSGGVISFGVGSRDLFLVGFGATPRGFDLPPCGAGNGVGIFRGMPDCPEGRAGRGAAPKKGINSPRNFRLLVRVIHKAFAFKDLLINL